jgi:hypothetical protein
MDLGGLSRDPAITCAQINESRFYQRVEIGKQTPTEAKVEYLLDKGVAMY